MEKKSFLERLEEKRAMKWAIIMGNNYKTFKEINKTRPEKEEAVRSDFSKNFKKNHPYLYKILVEGDEQDLDFHKKKEAYERTKDDEKEKVEKEIMADMYRSIFDLLKKELNEKGSDFNRKDYGLYEDCIKFIGTHFFNVEKNEKLKENVKDNIIKDCIHILIKPRIPKKVTFVERLEEKHALILKIILGNRSDEALQLKEEETSSLNFLNKIENEYPGLEDTLLEYEAQLSRFERKKEAWVKTKDGEKEEVEKEIMADMDLSIFNLLEKEFKEKIRLLDPSDMGIYEEYVKSAKNEDKKAETLTLVNRLILILQKPWTPGKVAMTPGKVTEGIERFSKTHNRRKRTTSSTPKVETKVKDLIGKFEAGTKPKP